MCGLPQLCWRVSGVCFLLWGTQGWPRPQEAGVDQQHKDHPSCTQRCRKHFLAPPGARFCSMHVLLSPFVAWRRPGPSCC